MDGVPFDQLLAQVGRLAPTQDPLDRVEAAVVVANALNGQAEAIVDHVVGQARAAGHSWTEIGVRLGVSKQAARKRFIDATEPGLAQLLPLGTTLRPRLQNCLTRAEELAREAGAAQIGAEHLLEGLMDDGVAATILERLGVTASAIATSSVRLFGPAKPPTGTAPTLSDDSACAIQAAAQRARVRAEDPNEVTVGTEHLLAVLALDHGSRAHRILVDIGVEIPAVKKELACYLTLNPPRPRRFRRGRRPS